MYSHVFILINLRNFHVLRAKSVSYEPFTHFKGFYILVFTFFRQTVNEYPHSPGHILQLFQLRARQTMGILLQLWTSNFCIVFIRA